MDGIGGVPTLPDAMWRRLPGLDRLVEALGGDTRARFVGGAVRDTMLGVDGKDVDLATRHAPDVVVRLLQDAGIKAVPTGIAHGTITAVSNGTVVEVTTLRRDVATDGRRAVVAFTDDWREDAARRDFTINALYAEPGSGVVHDYFGGLADLAARHVRFIGDPSQRIAEDHLRILRFFRFLARFGDTPDPDALAACTARANDLMALSRERIADELLKLLVARDAPRVVALMIERGIFSPVLPEITDAAPLIALAASEDASGLAADPIRRLAALLPVDAGEPVGARLKLSNAQRKRLQSAMTPASDDNPRALAYRIGRDEAIDRLALIGDVDAIRSLEGWTVPALPISGGSIVARGVAKGPNVAALLHAIADRWIAEDFPNSARVEAIADDVVGQWLRSRSN